MRKQTFCICENKDADQLRGNREADQRLCFRYTDSTIPLLPKSEISNQNVGFLMKRLIYLYRYRSLVNVKKFIFCEQVDSTGTEKEAK